MKKLSLLLSLITFVFLFVSCSKSIVFEETVAFPNNNWAFENKALNFKAEIKGSEKPLSLVLEFETIGTPNSNMIYTTITTVSPRGGKAITSIVLNFQNPREPVREGSTPNAKIYTFTVYPKRYFLETGTYSFEVNQHSNKADNYGIRSMRIYIEKVKE